MDEYLDTDGIDPDCLALLKLGDAAARMQQERDLDGLSRRQDEWDRVVARGVTEAGARLERAALAAGVDPKPLGTP